MREENKNRQDLTTSTASGFSDDEPPAAALVLAGHCFKRLAPLYPAILGQYLRSDSMTRTLVASWAGAIHAAGVDGIDLATAVRQVARGDLGGEPFSFPGVLGIARAFRRGRGSAQEAAPTEPPAPPASPEKVRAACQAIRAGLAGMSARSAAAFGTKNTAQH